MPLFKAQTFRMVDSIYDNLWDFRSFLNTWISNIIEYEIAEYDY